MYLNLHCTSSQNKSWLKQTLDRSALSLLSLEWNHLDCNNSNKERDNSLLNSILGDGGHDKVENWLDMRPQWMARFVYPPASISRTASPPFHPWISKASFRCCRRNCDAKNIEEWALATCWQTIPLWLHYVANTFTAIHNRNGNFHCVKMKMENFFFLDCLVSCDINELRTTVYRKLTHTNTDYWTKHPTTRICTQLWWLRLWQEECECATGVDSWNSV